MNIFKENHKKFISISFWENMANNKLIKLIFIKD